MNDMSLTGKDTEMTETQLETGRIFTREIDFVANKPSLPTLDYVLSGTSDIMDFCKRPLEIANVTPATTSTFSPWDLWFANAAVAAKLRNYLLVRGTMCLRFLVNAQPFWYGRYLIYLDPTSFGTSTSTYIWQASYACDYKAQLDLATNQSMTIKFPYMNPNQFIYNSGTITTNNKVSITAMYGPFDSQTGTGVSPTIKIYAWVEDLQMSIPVSQSSNGNNLITTVSDIASKAVPSEQRNGAISGPLTAISGAASSIEKVPIIGGIASMVSGVANIGGAVASLFGFSKPPRLQEPEPVVIKIAGDMATVSGTDHSAKLTMDPKHEKSVDPRSVDGSDIDPLSINAIAGREGILAVVQATGAQTVGTLVTQIRVHPCAMGSTASSGWQVLPMGFAALPFSKWSGSIIYRITMICSKFHRGRLAIYWNNAAATEPTSNVTNITFLEVGPGAECEVAVPYAYSNPTLNTQFLDYTDNATTGSFYNGFLYVAIDQVITAPSASANIGLIISARAGPDFVLGAPSNNLMKFTHTIPFYNTGNVTPVYINGNTAPVLVAAGTQAPSIAYQSSATNNMTVNSSSLLQVHPKQSVNVTRDVMGESFNSFRALLKRYTFSEMFLFNTTAAHRLLQIIRRFPNPSAYQASAGNMTLITYICLPFAFVSGSTRVKLLSDTSFNSQQGVIVTRGLWGNTTITNAMGYTAQSTLIAAENQLMGQALCGAALQPIVRGTVEFEIPDMNGNRMQILAQYSNPTTNECAAMVDWGQTGTTSNARIYLFYAAGDDFSPYVFMAIPVLYFYNANNPGT